MKVSWLAFWGFVGVGVLGAILLTDELLGVAHVWGITPITDQAESGLVHGDPTLFLLLLAAFLVGAFWWVVHIWDHRYW